MPTYLESLAARRQHERADVLLWEIERAFDEADPSSSARRSPKAQELFELVRFCEFDAIAPWLREERDALHRALAFAQKKGHTDVATILASALGGTAQLPATFSVSFPGREPQQLDVPSLDGTWFDGKDWAGTDIALSFAMDDFMQSVLDELVAARSDFELEPPALVQQRAEVDSRITAALQGGSAVTLFRQLISARNPRILAGDEDAADKGATDRTTSLPVKHTVNPALSVTAVAQLEQKYGPAAKDLLTVYSLHDGAELFCYEGECGFHLAPAEEWDALLNDALEWAKQVTWQDDVENIPSYLHSAIAFGVIPGDSERWLLVTEGVHAGKIMLSDTDLIEDEPRYDSVTQFMATLLNDPARILGCGGYVRYNLGGKELFPLKYSAE